MNVSSTLLHRDNFRVLVNDCFQRLDRRLRRRHYVINDQGQTGTTGQRAIVFRQNAGVAGRVKMGGRNLQSRCARARDSLSQPDTLFETVGNDAAENMQLPSVASMVTRIASRQFSGDMPAPSPMLPPITMPAHAALFQEARLIAQAFEINFVVRRRTE